MSQLYGTGISLPRSVLRRGLYRQAMFTAEAYFSQLFDDTSAFIRRFTKQYGGAARSAIVEVGCGTGEALIPHYDDAKPVKRLDERSRTLNTRCM